MAVSFFLEINSCLDVEVKAHPIFDSRLNQSEAFPAGKTGTFQAPCLCGICQSKGEQIKCSRENLGQQLWRIDREKPETFIASTYP